VIINYLFKVCPDLLRNPEYDLVWEE
jgi:hypothetical protein